MNIPKNGAAGPAAANFSPLDGQTSPDPLKNRDKALLEDVVDVLQHDVRLQNLPLQIFVRGGVAHISGTVSDKKTRALIRRKVAGVKDIHGVWDILVSDEHQDLCIIDLGCGKQKQVPWAVGVDSYPFEGVDVATDLEQGLPFADNQVDHVYAVHFLEHVRNLIPLMNEIHRVLKPEGIVHLIAPLASSGNAVADPTHVRFFNRQTLRYFCEYHPLGLPFRPLCASDNADTVYGDLSPVQPGEPLPSAKDLARFFF